MSRSRIRIIIVDDHPLVMDGVKSCLSPYEHIEVVGEAKCGRDAIRLASDLSPDIVLMDVNMPGQNGIDTTLIFGQRLPDVRLLILSMHDNREYIASALRYGARGYILKDVPTHEIVTAIEAVYRGGTYFSSGISKQLLFADDPQTGGPLTGRERTVLLLLAEGKSNKEVARNLDISVRTAETHRRNIKRKLKIGSTAGLTRYAIQNGLISAESVSILQ